MKRMSLLSSEAFILIQGNGFNLLNNRNFVHFSCICYIVTEMCKLYDLFSAHKAVQIWRKFHFPKSRNLFFTVEASNWILRLYKVNIGHIKVKNKTFLINFITANSENWCKKNTIYVDHDSKLVAEKFRDGADLLQIRLCTQISCPLLVAVNFRNSFWSAKNTGRSQEYFFRVFQINEQQTI